MTIFYNLSKFHLILTTVMHVMNSCLRYLYFFKILLRNPGRGDNYVMGLRSGRVSVTISLLLTRLFELDRLHCTSADILYSNYTIYYTKTTGTTLQHRSCYLHTWLPLYMDT